VIIVSNTTPLSELAKVGQLNLLQKLFGKIIIPQEVYNEVTTGNHRAAEAATIILAEELKANRVLIDEKLGRKVAQSRNLPVTGTIGLLLIAKKKGIIIEVKPILEQFLSQGKRISPILYQEILGMAEES